MSTSCQKEEKKVKSAAMGAEPPRYVTQIKLNDGRE